MQTISPVNLLIEYGGGASIKVRHLITRTNPAHYIPVDISKTHLANASKSIAESYPDLEIVAICSDFNVSLDLPEYVGKSQRVAYFPGSSIGNFTREAALRFLRLVGATLLPGGRFLLAVDKRKSPEILHAAYNDSKGVTATFNRNILSHVGRVFQASIDTDKFEHSAVYDETAGCIQMYLTSLERQVIELGKTEISFEAGEQIHTEDSHKYSREELELLATEGGFRCKHVWEDSRGYFMLSLLEVA